MESRWESANFTKHLKDDIVLLALNFGRDVTDWSFYHETGLYATTTYLCGPVARTLHNRAVGVLRVLTNAQCSVFVGLLLLFRHTYWAGARAASFGFKSCVWASPYSYIIQLLETHCLYFFQLSMPRCAIIHPTIDHT
jgi:hypothetical protein